LCGRYEGGLKRGERRESYGRKAEETKDPCAKERESAIDTTKEVGNHSSTTKKKKEAASTGVKKEV